MWSVYLVECADGSLYTGISKDVAERVRRHNSGHGARYTRARRPVVLVYSEAVGKHGDALRRECAIRRLSRSQKQALVAGCTV